MGRREKIKKDYVTEWGLASTFTFPPYMAFALIGRRGDGEGESSCVGDVVHGPRVTWAWRMVRLRQTICGGVVTEVDDVTFFCPIIVMRHVS